MERLESVLIKVLRVEDVQEDQTMETVPAWDSLSHMDLIASIESEFEIRLTGDEIAEMTSFDAIRRIVGKYIS